MGSNPIVGSTAITRHGDRSSMPNKDPNAQLDELAALHAGWLDGEGKEITSTSIGLSRILVSLINPNVLMQTGIFPTKEGGIQFEFNVNGKMCYEIGVSPEGDLTIWEFNMATGQDHEYSFTHPNDLVIKLQEILSKPLKQ